MLPNCLRFIDLHKLLSKNRIWSKTLPSVTSGKKNFAQQGCHKSLYFFVQKPLYCSKIEKPSTNFDMKKMWSPQGVSFYSSTRAMCVGVQQLCFFLFAKWDSPAAMDNCAVGPRASIGQTSGTFTHLKWSHLPLLSKCSHHTPQKKNSSEKKPKQICFYEGRGEEKALFLDCVRPERSWAKGKESCSAKRFCRRVAGLPMSALQEWTLQVPMLGSAP